MPNKVPMGQCQHCRAPEKSIFDPSHATHGERNYVVDTQDFKVTRSYFKQEVVEDNVSKKTKMKKVKQRSIKNMTISSLPMNKVNPLTITWSGNTFMTEFDNFMIDFAYETNKAQALRGRKKWNLIKKKLKTHVFKNKVQNAGPDWFQDLSSYQMELTDNLTTMLHRDIEEGKIPRTQEYLFEVGIAPNIPSKIVAETVKECAGNPIAFLFKLHEALVKIESEQYEKSFWEAKSQKKKISPFSINERILLTCAFHIHFPNFLGKLDQILPPGKPQSNVLWAKKPPKKKKEIYSSPYLEPQPINERPWYEERVEEELQKKVELRMKLQTAKQNKNEFEKKLAEQKRIADIEKEEKEKMRVDLLKKKNKEKLKQRKSRIRTGRPDQTIHDSNNMESGENIILPSRERKSNYFKHLEQDSGVNSTTQQDSSLKSKDDIKNDQADKSSDFFMINKQDPQYWIEVLVSDGCTQTPIKGIGPNTLYAAYVEDKELPKEGVTEAEMINLSKALPGHVQDYWTQTGFTNEFKPIKKVMREFLLKQRGIEKQMDKFYLSLMYKRGIFGPPTNSVCRTSCLLDLERMAINREITVIKNPSTCFEDDNSQEEYTLNKLTAPKDMSMKELLTVKRLPGKSSPMPERKISGPPIPQLMDTESHPGNENAENFPNGEIHDPSYAEAAVADSDYQPATLSKKPVPVECTDPGCELISPNDLPLNEFTLARKRIALLPIKNQLTAAIQYLSEKGDPLAVLPNIVQVPWLSRWFDRRNGVKRDLTNEDKDDLMKRSITYWNSDYIHCTTGQIPILPKEGFTWRDKERMIVSLEKLLYEHKRTVKHLLINNARDLFPTMFCEYFNSPLNKSFRKLFYTYFPSCERDCLVHKPWDPSEDGKDKKV